MKLSPAQSRLLHDLAVGPRAVHEAYAPAQKLIAQGLAVQEASGWAGVRIAITEGGRNLLWTPAVGDEALFVKSGNRVRLTAILPDEQYEAVRSDTGKAMVVTRAGLMPIPLEATPSAS